MPPTNWIERVVYVIIGIALLVLLVVGAISLTNGEDKTQSRRRSRYEASWVPISDDPDLDYTLWSALDEDAKNRVSAASPPRKLIIKPSSNDRFHDSHLDAFDEILKSQNRLYTKAVPLAIGETIAQWMVGVGLAIAFVQCLKRAGSYLETRIRERENVSLNLATPLLDNEAAGAAPTSADFPVGKESIERVFSDMAREKATRFSPQQLSLFTSNYATRLGSGGFGEVYRGELPNHVPIAVKVLKGRMSDKKVEEQFMAEVSTIGRTNHINLVRLYGFCVDKSMKALVYEYVENGSLDKLLFDRSKTIEWPKLQKIAVGTAKGLAYLHEECQQRIIHYDIKPGNVLLDGDFTPKVADFGLAKLCSRDQTHVTVTGFRGTPGYAAPEMWSPLPVTHKVDVYSFGMLLFEIVGRRKNMDETLPVSQEWFPKWVWKAFEKGELRSKMTLINIEEEDAEMAERMCKVALWCVQKVPENRPLMSSVASMLEGGVVISPPKPLALLVSSGVGGDEHGETTETGEETESADPATACRTPDKGLENCFEIELAS